MKPVPGWEKYPFIPDARNTMIAKAYVQNGKIIKVTYLPAYLNPDCEPELATRHEARAQELFDYVKRISEEQSLKVSFSREGDEVVVS